MLEHVEEPQKTHSHLGGVSRQVVRAFSGALEHVESYPGFRNFTVQPLHDNHVEQLNEGPVNVELKL